MKVSRTIGTVFLLALLAAPAPGAPGGLDPSFGQAGVELLSPVQGLHLWQGRSVVVQPDEKILVAAVFQIEQGNQDLQVWRFMPNGELDLTFGNAGVAVLFLSQDQEANAVALQADGKIVLAGTGILGSHSGFIVARFSSDGSLDASFGGTGFAEFGILPSLNARAFATAIQKDGRIVVAGETEGAVTNTD